MALPADTVGDVGRSCAIETAERQNTEGKPYPLWPLGVGVGRATTDLNRVRNQWRLRRSDVMRSERLAEMQVVQRR